MLLLCKKKAKEYNIKDKPNIIFMGTPEFAVPSLAAVHAEFGVIAVVTASDKPKGRGLEMQAPAVKIKALELGIPVLQPESLKEHEFINGIKSLDPDIIIVIAFRILPREIFTLSRLGTFNVHASLLPKYRGAAPINRAIIEGEKITGLTSFLLDEKVDTGSIILQRSVEIPPGTTAGELHDILMNLSPEFTIDTCGLIIENKYIPVVQDNSLASPAPKIFPEMCEIDWMKDTNTVLNFIHGLSPKPGAWVVFNSKRLKILRAVSSEQIILKAGEFIAEKGKLFIGTGEMSIEVIELQSEGRNTMSAGKFLAGYRGSQKGNLE